MKSKEATIKDNGIDHDWTLTFKKEKGKKKKKGEERGYKLKLVYGGSICHMSLIIPSLNTL